MSLWELVILAISLAMDAFAVSICIGLTMTKATVRNAAAVGLYFGIFQAAMPLIGFRVATLFADQIAAYDHWIAFGLLCFLGGKMIMGRRKEEGGPDGTFSIRPAKMLPLAVATSIDALAVGVSLAVMGVSILPAISLIGGITLALSMLGVTFGGRLGMRFKAKAEMAGGAVLILIGFKILWEHTGFNSL